MVRMNEFEYNQPACIQLSPFFHQVGGHSSMFQYDKTTICKVLELSELNFYQSMPESLKHFTPEFRGTITVEYREDESGHIKLVARSKIDDNNFVVQTDQQTNDNDNNNNSSKISVQSKKECPTNCSEEGRIDYLNSSGIDTGNYEQGKITMSKINPWGLLLCKKQAEKLHRQLIGDENVTISQKYILLENVTAKFHFPCILDLKMGKRQYADIDSDKKRLSKIQKCESSTSSTLGVRLCGMQVYQVDSGRYIFTDKYCGRSLTVDGFRTSLKEFLNNGRSKRLDILPEILERLQILYETIQSLVKYRFYSGSLLIVYDGLPQSNLIDIRMIDFAHTIDGSSSDETSASNNLSDPDKNYLFGLERLIDVFREILNDV